MGTGTGTDTGCGAPPLSDSCSGCRLFLSRASTRNAERNEGFMVDGSKSVGAMDCAPGSTSKEADLLRFQLRKMRTTLDLT